MIRSDNYLRVPRRYSLLMRIIFPTLTLLIVCLGLLGTGCAAPRAFNLPDPSEPSDALLMAPTMADPIEPVNRAAFALNEFLFAVAVEPATGVYNTLVPEPARTGIRNFRNNLFYPLRLFSNLLQGKWSGAGTETKRFLLNTTLGVAGLGDPATHKYGLNSTGEDLGQVFGHWGWESQIYLYVPLLGASSERDLLGSITGLGLDPASLAPAARLGMGFNHVSFSSRALLQMLKTEYDPYELAKMNFTLKRDAQVRDLQLGGSSEDTGQTQTLMAIYSRPKKQSFAKLADKLEINPEGFARPLTVSLWLQKKRAPIAWILPGLGGHRLSTRALALAEQAHTEGYHVICISNNFNWEFIRSAPADYLPGYMPHDLDAIRAIQKTVTTALTAKHGAKHFTSQSLLGFSMGAWYTLNLAATSPPETYEHAVAINPPLDLVHGLKALDRLYRTPGKDTQALRQIALLKIAVNQKQTAEQGADMPFTDAEASYLIGLSYRITLRQAILSGHLNLDGRDLPARRRLYNRVNALSWEDYFTKILTPHLAAQSIPATTLTNASDLRQRQAALTAAKSLHLVLTSNDFLLSQEHLNWFQKNFPNQITYNKKGGHMGQLWQPKVHQAISEVIRRK